MLGYTQTRVTGPELLAIVQRQHEGREWDIYSHLSAGCDFDIFVVSLSLLNCNCFVPRARLCGQCLCLFLGRNSSIDKAKHLACATPGLRIDVELD